MPRTQIEMQSAQANIASAGHLERIANALERIADAMDYDISDRERAKQYRREEVAEQIAKEKEESSSPDEK